MGGALPWGRGSLIASPSVTTIHQMIVDGCPRITAGLSLSGHDGQGVAVCNATSCCTARVPWPKSESLADASFRPHTPVFGGRCFCIRPFRHGFLWAVGKAEDSGGSPFSRIRLKVPGGDEQIIRGGKTQRQHAAVYRQRIDVSMDNGTRTLRLCEADRCAPRAH